HADEASLLPLLHALAIAVDDSGHAPVGAMLDTRRHALGTQIQVTGGLSARYFRVQRAPLRTRFAALGAEPLLYAERTIVARARVDSQIAGMNALVTHFLRGGVQHLEVVGGRHAGVAVPAGYAQPLLSHVVIAQELLVRDGPVDE